MFPRPATTVWSRSAALIGVRRPFRRPPKHPAVERGVEGFGAESRQKRVGFEVFRAADQNGAESPGIAKSNDNSAFESEFHVFMLFDRGNRRRRYAKAAGHAQMDDQGRSAVHVDQQVFGPAPDGRDASIRQTIFQIGGNLPAQISPQTLHRGHARARQHGLKTATNRFDLGQFRHVP